MRKILYVVRCLAGCNGADQSARDILNVLVKRDDVELEVMALNSSSFATNSLSYNVITFPRKYETSSYVDCNYLANVVCKIKADWQYTQILKRLKKQSYDLLISNEFSAMDILPFVRAKKSVCILRNAPQTYQGAYSGHITGDLAFTGASQYSSPVAVSKKTAECWDDERVFKKKCRVIPNCAQEDRSEALAEISRSELRERCQYHGKPVIVCVASIQYRKGQDVLLNAWLRVREKWPDAALFLVGPANRDSWYAALKHRIELLGADSGIVCTGAVQNPMEYTRAADLFVLPSRDEALPRTVLEAMLLKTPIVASDVAGIPEMIVDEKMGLLFESENHDHLGKQIVRMLSDSCLQTQCVENAYNHYWSNYSRELFDMRWNKLLDDIL